LVRVLEDWSPSVQGLFLYYPGHRQVPATLRALIELIRAVRGATSGTFNHESLHEGLSGSKPRCLRDSFLACRQRSLPK
jgi:hypothetical protein